MSCLFVLCVCVCSFFTLVRSSFLLVSSSTLPHFLIFLILGIAAQNMSTTHPSHTYFIRCMVYEYFQSTHSRLMADRAKYNSHNKWTIKPKMKNTFHILICESISQSTPFILKRAKIERAITHTHKKNSVCPKQNEVEIECDIVTIQSVCGGAKKNQIHGCCESQTNCESHGWSQDDWTFTMSLFRNHLAFIYLSVMSNWKNDRFWFEHVSKQSTTNIVRYARLRKEFIASVPMINILARNIATVGFICWKCHGNGIRNLLLLLFVGDDDTGGENGNTSTETNVNLVSKFWLVIESTFSLY